MGQVAVGADRGLVPGGDVGHLRAEDAVEAAQHVEVEGGQLGPFGVVQRRQVGQVPERVEVHLEGPAGGVGHERHPAPRLGDHPHLRVALGGDQRAEQAGAGLVAVAPGRAQRAQGPRRHER